MANELNLSLPGNPRYQPTDLVEIFGYDYLIRPAIEVEIATMEMLGEFGIIPASDFALLTSDVKAQLLTITTTAVDRVERAVTHHDIRALIRLMQDILPTPLRRWVHIPLTSYDVISTVQAMQFKRAFDRVLAPKAFELMKAMATLIRENAGTLQIGRTHGQHAIPITVGFWLATILERIRSCMIDLEGRAGDLVGKISGPVGAYNAQVAFKMDRKGAGSFEGIILNNLGLGSAHISTQIAPPEPIARFLFSCLQLSAVLGQFGRDARNLMRTEIGEIGEEFVPGQVGSSTMAHKRNPINFENLEGAWLKNLAEFNKVLACLLSDHQRDLVGSSIMRDFPVIVVNLTHQLDTLLRRNNVGDPFILRISIDEKACKRNFAMCANVLMAEPVYIALQMAGYAGDGHKLVNNILVPMALNKDITLFSALYAAAEDDEQVMQAYLRIPEDIITLLNKPEEYTGRAREKAFEIASAAEAYVSSAEDDLDDID